MKRPLSFAALALSLTMLWGCKNEPAMPAQAITSAELTAMANAVPSEGPREGNAYKVFFLALRQDQAPAAGFRVDAWVKGKSEPKTVKTDERGLAAFEDLPFPGARNQLVAVLHYYRGGQDQSREITYPYIEGDAYRLKDIQYIPNDATPEPN